MKNGVTFIHDHFKAPLWTMDSVVAYLGAARARRTFIVVGTLSDYAGAAAAKYRRLASSALEHVDHVVFCNHHASRYLRNLREKNPDRLHLFAGTRKAADFISEVVKPGDLVLLKGSLRADHLERVAANYRSSVQCWQSGCGREGFCHECDLRNVPSD